MGNSSEHVIAWRKRTKERIVQAFDGKCGICGYSKCHEALELHHLDPSKKEFGLGGIRANPKAWKKIVLELRKCVLLCSNCHREYHSGLISIPESIRKFNETFSVYKKIEKRDRASNLRDMCPVCSGEKYKDQTTCSHRCAAQIREKYDWEKFDLRDLYVEKKMSQHAISRLVGCSDVAVRKRLFKEGLRTK